MRCSGCAELSAIFSFILSTTNYSYRMQLDPVHTEILILTNVARALLLGLCTALQVLTFKRDGWQ